MSARCVHRDESGFGRVVTLEAAIVTPRLRCLTMSSLLPAKGRIVAPSADRWTDPGSLASRPTTTSSYVAISTSTPIANVAVMSKINNDDLSKFTLCSFHFDVVWVPIYSSNISFIVA